MHEPELTGFAHPTFAPELMFSPIVHDRHVFVILKPGTLPDTALWGNVVGFDTITLTIRLLTLPVSVILPWNGIAAILPLAPDWALQGDEKHEKLLASIARLWGQGKPLQGPDLEALKAQYTRDIGPLSEEDQTSDEAK